MSYFCFPRSEQLRVAPVVVLSDEEEAELTKLVRSKRTQARLDFLSPVAFTQRYYLTQAAA
jgi:hypothetical protein